MRINILNVHLVIDQTTLAMVQSNEKSIEKLRKDYINLVKAGLKLQQKGDIKAFTQNAIRAEYLAQKLQAVSRKH